MFSSAKAMPTPDVAEIQWFFETLYGQAGDGKLILSWPSAVRFRPDGTPGLDSDWLDLAQASWPVIARAASRRAYFGVVLQHPTAVQVRESRSKNATAYLAPGLWMDIDLASGQHKQTGPLPATVGDVLALLQTLPRAPSLMVHTMGGVHAYWLFRELFMMDNAGDRAEFAHLSTRFTTTLARLAQEAAGWQLDRLGDLARVLRAPGTITAKYQRRVALLSETGYRYNPQYDFDDWLDVLPMPARPAPRDPTAGAELPIQVVAEHYQMALTTKSTTELAGAHPVHGSSTGSNVNINPAKNCWHCWRCSSGGGPFHLLAVCEGLLPCEQAGPGALRGELFRHVLTLATEKFGLQSPRRPRHQDATIARYRAQIHADPYFGAQERRGTGITPAILVTEKETSHA